MGKLKKIITFFVVTVFILSVPVTAMAAQSLSCWYADVNYVAYTPYDGSYYVYDYSTDSTFKSWFKSAVLKASSQWNSTLPISVGETSFNYAVNYVFGGELTQLKKSFPALEESMTGLTDYLTDTGKGVRVTYNGSSKTVYPLKAGCKMCIVQKNGRTANGYTKTALHEMGHLFGWGGHSSSTQDVMYGKSSEITSLTLRDKNHLKQIYTMFR